jgi:hypothetical protein
MVEDKIAKQIRPTKAPEEKNRYKYWFSSKLTEEEKQDLIYRLESGIGCAKIVPQKST